VTYPSKAKYFPLTGGHEHPLTKRSRFIEGEVVSGAKNPEYIRFKYFNRLDRKFKTKTVKMKYIELAG